MGVRVKLLGTFEIEGLDPRRLGSRKARTLLKLLAVARGQPVAVDRVIECVWPDDLAPSRPDEQVAVLVSRLRTVIGSDSLVKTSAGYQLVVDWLDIDAVADLTDQAARQLAAGNCALARVMAEAALERIRGPVLADEHEASWVAGERAPMERIIAGLRHTAARAALSGADFDTAARYASLALDADPYDELASRLAIRAHDGAGRPASALAVYAAFRERIVEELGAGGDAAPATAQSGYIRLPPR